MHRRSLLIRAVLIALSAIIGASAAAEPAQPDTAWKPSPSGAVLRSLVLPGWGQAYVRHPLKAVIYGGIEQGLVLSIYRQERFRRYYQARGEEENVRFYRDQRDRLTWYLAGSILLSTLDAYVDAHLYDFDVSEEGLNSIDKNRQNSLQVFGITVKFNWIFE